MRQALAWVTTALVLAGCLGSDKTFPDETSAVTQIHLNAYQEPNGSRDRPAILEVRGIGADGQEVAFLGTLAFQIDEQKLGADGSATYLPVKSWSADVAPKDFSSPTVAYYRTTLAPSDLPDNATYRATVTATLGARALNATQLFAFHHD